MKDFKGIIKQIDRNQIIICIDTSALLEVYSFSPDTFRFILECFNSLKRFIFIPRTVAREFFFQNTGHFKKAHNNSSMLLEKLNSCVEKETEIIKVEIKRMSEHNYPNVSNLLSKVDEIKNIMEKAINEYKINNSSISTLEENYYNEDYFGSLIKDIVDSNPGHELSLDKIYAITEYADKCTDYVGKKDKKKPGLRKYNDILIWNEIIEYSKTTKRDVLLLTCETKNDWFDIDGAIKTNFTQQFIDGTGHSIEVTNKLLEFYTEYGRIHKFFPKDATRLSLECLFENMIESKKIENKLSDYILASNINNMCSEYCFGQFESFEDAEIIDIDMIENEVLQFEAKTKQMTCSISYSVKINAIGKVYSGHDWEDNEYYWLCAKSTLSGVFNVILTIVEGGDTNFKVNHTPLRLEDYEEGDIIVE